MKVEEKNIWIDDSLNNVYGLMVNITCQQEFVLRQ